MTGHDPKCAYTEAFPACTCGHFAKCERIAKAAEALISQKHSTRHVSGNTYMVKKAQFLALRSAVNEGKTDEERDQVQKD